MALAAERPEVTHPAPPNPPLPLFIRMFPNPVGPFTFIAVLLIAPLAAIVGIVEGALGEAKMLARWWRRRRAFQRTYSVAEVRERFMACGGTKADWDAWLAAQRVAREPAK